MYPKTFYMFHNKKITILGHEIYCRDNNRYMALPHKQVVTKSGFKFNLPNSEIEIKVNKFYYLEQLYFLVMIVQSLINS